MVLNGCATPQVTQIQKFTGASDAPYDNVLVISLFKSYDARIYLEKEIVKQLKAKGVDAVASTSLMDSRTPATRETFVAMVDSLNSDAVLVTQLVNLEAEAKMKDARPEATYNIRPTYYYNVWSVDLKEYVAPQRMQLKYVSVLATQLYSVAKEEAVWAIESKTNFTMDYDESGEVSANADEAKAITSYLSRDGLLAP